MAEYKGKLLKGLFTQAKNVLMSDGTTDVENAINNSVTTDLLTVSSVNHDVSKTYTKLPKAIIVSSTSPDDKDFVTGVIYISGADSAISNVVTIYFEGGSTATILASVSMISKTLTLTLRNVVFDGTQLRFVELY